MTFRDKDPFPGQPSIGDNNFRSWPVDPADQGADYAHFVTCSKCGQTGVADPNSPGVIAHSGNFDGTSMILHDVCIITPEAVIDKRSMAMSLLVSIARQTGNPERTELLVHALMRLESVLPHDDFIDMLALALTVAIAVGSQGFTEGDRIGPEGFSL